MQHNLSRNEFNYYYELYQAQVVYASKQAALLASNGHQESLAASLSSSKYLTKFYKYPLLT